MKVISKYFKVALCFMAFALCSFMFAFTPTYTAVQAAEMAIESYNVAINALKMPTEEVNYEEGDEFNIPLLTSSVKMGTTAPTNYTIRVIDPSGYKHDYVVGQTTSNSFFKAKFTATAQQATKLNLVEGKEYLPVNAKSDGEYKVVYIYSEGTGESKRTYYSNTYKVKVANVSYELDFSTPIVEEIEGAQQGEDKFKITGYTKNLIKTTMGTSTSEYELPIAYAKNVNGELTIDQTTGKVSNKTASVNVIFSPKDGTYEGDVFTTRTDENGVARYYINPTEEGIYTVEYFYADSTNRPTKTFKIVVDKDFEVSSLKLASTPTMPKIELGKTVTLPKLTVNAGTEKNVEVNVKSIMIEKEGVDGVSYELKNNNFSFEMSPATFGVDSYDKLVGNYRITYMVEGAYGEAQPLTEIFKVDGVTVSSKPTIKLSYNYDLETDATTQAKSIDSENVVFGAETELEVQYEKDTEFVLPAVYVEDAVTTNFMDFKIIRTIRKGGKYYYIDNLKYNASTGEFDEVLSTDAGYNAAVDSNIGDPTKAVKFKFNTEAESNKNTVFTGTYYLEYRVITKQVKERESYLYMEGSTDKYTFSVVNSASDYTDPTIEITNLKDSSVKNTDTFTVKVTATDSRDTRLKNVVFTHAGLIDANKIDGKTTFEQYLELVEGNLRAKVGTNKYCHILDDARLIYGWNNDGVKAEDPATAENKGLAYYFTDIEKLTENETKNNFDLKLTNKSGTVYVVAATQNDGGAITASETKTLTIKDTSDAQEPEMKIYASKLDAEELKQWKNGNSIVEFKVGQGEKVTLPSVYVVDTDKTLSLNVMYYVDSPENSYGAVEYRSPSNKNFYYTKLVLSGESEKTEVQVIDGGTITTSETGIYYVAYTATDVAGNTTVMYFTFEVEDTSKPILAIEPVADGITIAGNTLTGSIGTVVDFETTLKSADGKIDYTSDENITISIDDGGKGLDYQPSGNSRTSYVFNSVGTYVVTISGQYAYDVDDKGTTETDDDEVLYRSADNKIIKVVIEKQDLKWLEEFNVTEYAEAGTTIKLPDVAANNGAVVEVNYVAPNDNSEDKVKATKVVEESGFSYWTFTTSEDANGSFTVIYTATSDDDVITKEFTIKVGDYQPPTLEFNAGELTQNFVYDGQNAIEYILQVNKTKKSFVVKVINNGKEVVTHNIGLVISDTDSISTTPDVDIAWSRLEYELTGDNVTKGETSTKDGTTTTYYTITGPGSYSLKLKATDDNGNVNDGESIDFKVVTKSSVKENKDTVVGAVLIVISLVLLAGVILFFAFTGKKGGKKTKSSQKSSRKTTRTKQAKAEEKTELTTEEVTEVKEEAKVEETAEDVAEEVAEEVVEEQAEVVEEKVDDEPKTGDVE